MEIEGVDIALLQEVARRPALRVDEWLTRRSGMAYVYSRANGHEMSIGFEEGVAIFSRFPLSSPQSQQLGMGSNPFVRRLALGADVATPCGSLSVFSVHLGLLRHHNVRQVAHLLSWVTAVVRNQRAVIGGDFNAHEETRQITGVQDRWVDTFRHLHPHADGATHELRWPWGRLLRRHRLDYLFLQPDHRSWQVLKARRLYGPSGPHSDHRAVLARLAPGPSL